MQDPRDGRPLAAFFPAQWQAELPGLSETDPDLAEAGLYLSSYVGFHRLLHIPAPTRYHLFLWTTDRAGRVEAHRQRRYAGAAKFNRYGDGDRRLDLDMAAARASDRWDEALYVVGAGSGTLLLRKRSMRGLATSIGWNSTLGESERYFTRISGPDAIPDLHHQDFAAPPLDRLPKAIRRLVLCDPVVARVTEVFDDPASHDHDPAPITVIIDKGSEDGLRQNMPMTTPPGGARHVIGWCSLPEARTCRLRVKLRRDEAGRAVLPQPGDLLTTRAGSAPPLT